MSRRTRIGNVATVARREYVVRARSRTFVIGTLLLLAGVMAIAFAPALVERLGRTNPTRVTITSVEPALATAAAAALEPLLAGVGGAGSATGNPIPGSGFVITAGGPLDDERARITSDELDGVLDIARRADGELVFTYYTEDSATGRTAVIVRQGANAFAIADRLTRLGVAPGDRGALFTPAEMQIAPPDPGQSGPAKDEATLAGEGMLGFGMTILIFMMVIIYGNWIAQSVVEEKSSRVMEVVLNAATPFELLTGKVLGVGAVALTQYAALFVGGAAALLLQGPITGLILEGTGAGSMDVPLGVTPALLAALAVYGVLGFLLYATLFAAAGSLVSRSEDVSSAVTPLTMLCTLGYLIAVYSSTGLLDFGDAWMIGFTLVPFLSPFTMLGRIGTGEVELWQLATSIGLLAVSVVVALWIAARIYAVGVLLYGSWPGWKGALRLLRQGM